MANIVAIVGRPNVGKSTLFNRLIEQRKAIMDNESGVTRDRHYGHAEWTDKHFTVIDTGGYLYETSDPLEKAICQQIEIAIEEASVVLFVVDCKEGLTAADKDFAKVLRRSRKPVLITANKADNSERTLVAHDFHQLGMGAIYPIAAANGSGTGELLDEVVKHFRSDRTEEADEAIPKIAILGRPNVGKSSFLNVLVGEERSITLPVAGTTRDAIHTYYKRYGKCFLLIDTAGIRKKTKVKEPIEFYSVMRSISALKEADVCIILLDAEKGIEAQDINITLLAHRYKKGILILVNKWDLIKKDHYTYARYRKEVLEKLAPMDYIPIIFISTIKKQRIYQAIEKAMEIYKSRMQRLPTATLNKIMLKAIEKYPPPAIKGKHIKIKYVTQLPTPTPTFAFFCNLPQYIKAPYERYLENQLREHSNFQGVPIKLVFRKK